MAVATPTSPTAHFVWYAVRRVLVLIPLLVVIAFVIFVMLDLAPGEPATLILGQNATPEAIANLERRLGLDQPLLVQFVDFLWNAVQGDLGESYRTTRTVSSEILRTAPVSAILAATAMGIASVVGVGLGIISAVKQHTFLDDALRVFVLAGVSIPVFWLGLLMIVWFSVGLELLPAFGWGTWQQMVLPAVTLSTFPLAVIARLTRSSMLEVLSQDHIRVARANGLPERMVVLKYALKSALIPVLTVIGLQFGALIAGAILTETVFGLPGLGRVTITAILARDYPIVRGAVLFGTTVFVVVNLIVDLLYAWIDPRQRVPSR